MARIYFDQDADLEHLEGRTVAVIGYGNQGQAQALNLRDSSVNVIVGSPPDASARQAEGDGFEVRSVAEAARAGDVLLMLIPDDVMPAAYRDQVQPGLREGDALIFASGYNVAFGRIVPPSAMDVAMVAPRMIGKGVRETFLEGRGFPSLVAVEQDATGRAMDVTLAIAKGIGSTRMGAIHSSFREEALVDLFTEQSGGLQLYRLMFEALVEAGCDPDVVLLELYASGELSEMWAAARDLGLFGQLRLHSRTSQYGQQVTSLRHLDADEVRRQFRAVIEHITSGTFAEEWDEERRSGFARLRPAAQANLSHPMQLAENRLYRELRRRTDQVELPEWLGD